MKIKKTEEGKAILELNHLKDTSSILPVLEELKDRSAVDIVYEPVVLFQQPIPEEARVEIQVQPDDGKEESELVIYHCEKPKNLALLIKTIEEKFPQTSFKDLELRFGVMCLGVEKKK